MSGPAELHPGKGPGQWTRILIDEFGDQPHWGAMVRCPDCGRRLPLVNHSIGPDGQVSPSIGHPATYPPCGWHPTPRLVGWAPCPPAPAPRPLCDPCVDCGVRARQLGGWGIASGGLRCPPCLSVIVERARQTSAQAVEDIASAAMNRLRGVGDDEPEGKR